MPKPLVDAYILMSLFAPLMATICAAHGAMPPQTSVLQMHAGWQLLLLASLVMPIFGVRRLRSLTTHQPGAAK